ncbi:MAG: MerR family transcriptional regulator [Pseudonocardia sp.]|nr:MerR family transcriptional regulator [Pseudonocardia sp.]
MPARDTAAADAPHDSSRPAPTVQIGEVARRIGLSIRTIRHWEEMGLVTPTARSAGGFRLYSEDDVARLRLLRFMKPLDLTLEEMRELMRIRELLAESTPDESDRVQALVWPRSSAAGAERAHYAAQLASFVDRAERRLDKLRAQVGEVEEFVARLRSEVRQGTQDR